MNVDDTRRTEFGEIIERQGQRLGELNARLETLSRRRAKKGGLPWGLIALVAGGYALYRNEGLRTKLMGFVRQLDPGVKGNLARAGAEAKQGLEAVKQGESPQSALEGAAAQPARPPAPGTANAADAKSDPGARR